VGLAANFPFVAVSNDDEKASYYPAVLCVEMNAEKKMVVQVTAPHVQLRNLKAAMVNDFRAACARGEHGAAPASARGGKLDRWRTWTRSREETTSALAPSPCPSLAEPPRL